MEWKWSNGETYDKSKREIKKQNKEYSVEEKYNQYQYQETYDNEKETAAYLTSLNHDENTWDILNQTQYLDNGFRVSNKREETDKKIAERQMMAQVSMNPYMTHNNYVNDVITQNSFMKPQPTTWDREKMGQE